MDLLSLHYFIEVSKDLHITRTANRLFISQQTLSNHILRLEEYYGVKLLHRKPTIALTQAGEYVLEYAKTLNRESANLKDILSDIQQEHRGLILFGSSTLRMATCLPDILPVFSSKYPNVEIRITDAHSKKLEELILKGELDLAISLPQNENAKIIETPLMPDQVYLCVTNSLLQRFYGKEAESIKERAKKGTDLRDFSKLPFCMLDNRIGRTIEACFDEAGFSPIVYSVSAYMQISISICFSGLAACFATRTSLHNLRGAISKDVLIFPLYYKNQPLIQQTTLIHHQDRYLSHYTSYFFELISHYFKRLEQLPIEQLAASGLRDYYPHNYNYPPDLR